MCGIRLRITVVTKYMYKSQIPELWIFYQSYFFVSVMNAKI